MSQFGFFMRCFRIQSLQTLFILLNLSFILASQGLNLISIDTLQTYTISSTTLMDFQIANESSFAHIGTFYVSLKCLDTQDCTLMSIKRKQCTNQLEFEETFLEQSFDSDTQSAEMSFIADASDKLCFYIGSSTNKFLTPMNFSIIVKFTPIEITLQINKPKSFELTKQTKNEFAIHLKNKLTEIILITIKPKGEHSSANLQVPDWELQVLSALCLKSENSLSWLCYIDTLKDIFKFEVLCATGYGSYEISVSEIKPQIATPNIEALSAFSIPGHGSLFAVDLPLVGVLKLTGMSQNQSSLKITGATSLSNLFGSLLLGIAGADMTSSERKSIVIQNRKANTRWYYFVNQKDTQYFWLTSYFIKQEVLEVDSQALYYIDPEIYEYQHIKLELAPKQSTEKYEVVLHSLQSGSSMNLYCETSGLENFLEASFPNKNNFEKKASMDSAEFDYLYLSFAVKSHTKVTFLSIQALKRGYYSVEVKRIQPKLFLLGILVSSIICCVVLCCFACSLCIENSNEFEELSNVFNRPSNERSDPAPTNEPPGPLDLEMDSTTISVQIVVADNTVAEVVSIPKRLRTVVEKLKLQDKSEQLDKTSFKKIEQDKENISEDEVCDICYEAKKTVTFNPCNHKCACAFCALIIIQTSAKCPLCRSHIAAVQ